MGYYIRVLATKDVDISLADLRALASPAVIEGDDAWEQVVLKHANGTEIAAIERNRVIEGELGAEEIQELIEEVEDCRPRSASEWLQAFLPSVKVIYAFRLLEGTNINDGWTPLDRVHHGLWKHVGGIMQADLEGYSNEDGYTIVWQFSDRASGPWNFGVLADGGWTHFEMELSNRQQREEFLSGRVPEGAKLVS